MPLEKIVGKYKFEREIELEVIYIYDDWTENSVERLKIT